MLLPFHKYEGTGNDFILVDNRSKNFAPDAATIAALCNRHFGIGADGLLLLQLCEGFDFEMVYFNSDGSPATFCGNGGRCITAFAQHLGIISKSCTFRAADGVHAATVMQHSEDDYFVELGMREGMIYKQSQDLFYLNTGTYHVVKFVKNPLETDVVAEGRHIRQLPEYLPHGTNVNFAAMNEGKIVVRTYEKGVEEETLSCGTGATASAIAASLRYGGEAFELSVKGGILKVTFDRKGESFTNVKLSGPARHVFAGTIKI